MGRARKRLLLLSFMLPILCLPPALAACQNPIQSSHTSAHIPDEQDFDGILRRDLTAFFAGLGLAEPRVEFDLLRNGPTQSGVAYPKFYLWVVVISANGDRTTGAVRVAAVERQRFDVTDFVSSEDIVANPEAPDAVFPAAPIPAIIMRAEDAA